MTWAANDTKSRTSRSARGVDIEMIVDGRGQLGMLLAAATGTTLVSDLALGQMRPHQIAAELYAQLDLQPPRHAEHDHAVASGSSERSDFIGRLIDAETMGYRPISYALSWAEQLVRALADRAMPVLLVILTPINGDGLGEENEAFLQCLASQLGADLRIVGLGPVCPKVPAHWLLAVETMSMPMSVSGDLAEAVSGIAWLPGLLRQQDFELAGEPDMFRAGARRLGNLYLVDPRLRRPGGPDDQVAAARHALLAVVVANTDDPWLRAFAVAERGTWRTGPDAQTDLQTLIVTSWQAIAEGSYALCKQILNAGSRLTAGTRWSSAFEGIAQGVRIGLEDYRSAADAPEPSAAARGLLRGMLLQFKGWGLVMTGQHARAAAYLEAANGLVRTEPPTREYLYFLNILALLRVRQGQESEGQRLEEYIRDELLQAMRPDPHLLYINSINLMRIHIRKQEPDAAARYFDRAFDTSVGIRSLTDHVTRHIYKARIGALRADTATVRRHLLRAALYWVSAPLPETVSRRCAQLLIGYNLPDRAIWPDAISQALLKLLRDAWGQEASVMDGPVPVFAMTEAVGSSNGIVVGTRDCTVILSRRSLMAPYSSTSHEDLRRLLAGLLRGLSPQGLHDGVRSILLDDRCGTDLAETPEQVRLTGLKCEAEMAWFEGSRLPEAAMSDLSVSTAAAVQTIEHTEAGSFASFRRYRQPRLLTACESSLMAIVAEGPVAAPSLSDALRLAPRALLALLWQLERDRVITLDCIAADRRDDRGPGGPKMIGGFSVNTAPDLLKVVA